MRKKQLTERELRALGLRRTGNGAWTMASDPRLAARSQQYESAAAIKLRTSRR